MGYSTNPGTLIKFKHQLAALEAGNLCSWQTEDNGAQRFAYKVREALSIALRYPERFPTLAEMATRVTVTTPNHNTVTTEWARNTPEAVLMPSGETGPVLHGATPTHGQAAAGRGHFTMAGTQTAKSIIAFWMQKQPSNTALSFPQAALSNTELHKLWSWAQHRTPPWMLLVYGTAVTLSPYDPTAADAAWSPAQEPTPQESAP